MLWIGLTGGIATGKSTVKKRLLSLGYHVIDADELAHQVQNQSPAFDEIVKEFGTKVLDTEGRLNRKEIGRLVFSDPIKLRRLELILHPRIREEVQTIKNELIAKNTALAFYDVPLLFEKKMEDDFNLIVVVGCSLNTQITRMKKRDHLSEEEIKNRLSNQIPIEEKVKMADFVLNNEGNLNELYAQIDKFLDHINTHYHEYT